MPVLQLLNDSHHLYFPNMDLFSRLIALCCLFVVYAHPPQVTPVADTYAREAMRRLRGGAADRAFVPGFAGILVSYAPQP